MVAAMAERTERVGIVDVRRVETVEYAYYCPNCSKPDRPRGYLGGLRLPVGVPLPPRGVQFKGGKCACCHKWRWADVADGIEKSVGYVVVD